MGSPIDFIYGLGQTNLAVPPGVTAVQIKPPAFTRSISIKYSSGGSLAFINDAVGASPGVGYVVGSSEVVSLNGPCAFYLQATGATAVASILFGKSAGYSAFP